MLKRFTFTLFLLLFACSESSEEQTRNSEAKSEKNRISAFLLIEKEEGIYYYQNEKFNGVAYTEHKNGNLWSEAYIAEGIIDSTKSFNEDGTLWYENKYINGVLHMTLDYHENGKLAHEESFEGNKIISKKCFDENGIEIKCN